MILLVITVVLTLVGTATITVLCRRHNVGVNRVDADRPRQPVPLLTIHQKRIFTCFTEDVSPRTISTFRFGTPNSSARNSQIAAFAFPFSGAAVIFTFSDPSSSTPTISFRELFGITFNIKSRFPC